MLLHLSAEAGQVLYCPVCNRELLPAYWTDDGLDVAYLYDLEPDDGQAGLLICGDFNCEYEEPVTFATTYKADAVVLSLEETMMAFGGHLDYRITALNALQVAEELEQAFVATGRAQLQSAAEYFRMLAETHQDLVERWLAEAAQGYSVSLEVDDETIEGQVLTTSEDEFVLQLADGQVRVMKKNEVYGPRILYPRKAQKPRKPFSDSRIFLMIGELRIVVNGIHLKYEATNDFGLHMGGTKDPDVAASLGFSEVVPGYWRGVFQAEEIERYYVERTWVKIGAYWLMMRGRSHDDYVWVSTEDPEAARALDMEPAYAMEATEFGGRDGDLVGYRGTFPAALIEATRSEEEVEPLPKW